jgi:SH3-like domain-containing protein
LKTNTSLIIIFLLIFSKFAFAQRDIVYSYSIPVADALSVCAWPEAMLRDQPGTNARRIASLYFGEGVEKTGDEGFVMYEKRNYIKVRTRDGKVGWVSEELFVPDGGVVVVLERARIYMKPNTVTTVTDGYFEPGELAIFKDWQGDWVELVSKEWKKSGWIKGTHLVSIENNDIQTAKSLEEALAVADAPTRRYRLEQILQMRDGVSPDMREAIDQYITGTRYDPWNDGFRPPATPAPGNVLAQAGGAAPTAGADETSKYNIVVQEVIDMETGKSYQRVTETGTAYEVIGPKNPKNIYWVYHKTRPIGSKVLLQVPNGGGYVQLEVVNRLRKDNPNTVGLGKDLMMAVYGTRYPGEVVISYPR